MSLFRDLGVPRRLAQLVEGESLFNDGAANTLFSIVLAAIITGRFNIADGVLRFNVTVVGALAVGVLIGAAGLQGLTMPVLIRKLDLVSTNVATNELPILRARLHAV